MRRDRLGWPLRLSIVTILGLGALACGDSSDPVTGPGVEPGLNGLVILDAMAPLPGVGVQLRRDGLTLSATTDDVGHFGFAGLAVGEWEMILNLPRGYAVPAGQSSRRTVDVPASGVADVRIAVVNGEGSGSFVVQTFADSLFPDGNQFLAVAGILVEVFEPGGSEAVAATRSGDNGIAVISVPEGVYDVGIELPEGWQMAGGSQQRIDDLSIASGESRRLEFHISQDGGGGTGDFGTIVGTALLDDIEPVSGLEAVLGISDFLMVATSGQDGTFTFANLSMGTWTLSVTPPEGYVLAPDEPNPQEIVISAENRFQPVTISLARADDRGALVVQVTGESQQDSLGIRDVAVRVFEGGGASAVESGTTDHGGRATFRLVPGSYDVEITAPSGYELPPGDSGRRGGFNVTTGHSVFAWFSLIEASP